MTTKPDAALLRQTILDLATSLGPDKSVSPSDAARAIAGKDEKEWRLLMKPIRSVAVKMAKEGLVAIIRKGKPVDPKEFRGVYRIAVLPLKATETAD